MELQIEHRSGEHRWVLLDAARHIVGELNYAVTNESHWRIRYVEVEPFFQGRGFAKRLVEAIFQYTLGKSIRLSSSCSYATAMLANKRHQNL